MNATQAKSALIALLFIITMGLMVIDRRAPFFVLMGFALVGMIMSLFCVVYHATQMHTRKRTNVVYMSDRRK